MIRNRYTCLLFIACLLCIACGGNPNDKEKKSKKHTLNIAVAANVQFAIKEIKTAFEATFDFDVNVIIASSGKLTAQIKQGAPYDLLIAANLKYPESLYQDGYAMAEPKIYAYGSLVLWTMEPDLNLDGQLAILNNNTIKKIGIANPKNAPYGEQAINALNHFGSLPNIQEKLVYGESIAQTNQFVLTKNCEVGITAKSVVLAPQLKGKGYWIDITSDAYQPISQGVIITKYGALNHIEIAQQFYDFLFSENAKSVFERFGYTLPSG